jgi:hypothetical protein
MQAFVGLAMNQLVNVLDKTGYRKVLKKNSVPRSPSFPIELHLTAPYFLPLLQGCKCRWVVAMGF